MSNALKKLADIERRAKEEPIAEPTILQFLKFSDTFKDLYFARVCKHCGQGLGKHYPRAGAVTYTDGAACFRNLRDRVFEDRDPDALVKLHRLHLALPQGTYIARIKSADVVNGKIAVDIEVREPDEPDYLHHSDVYPKPLSTAGDWHKRTPFNHFPDLEGWQVRHFNARDGMIILPGERHGNHPLQRFR